MLSHYNHFRDLTFVNYTLCGLDMMKVKAAVRTTPAPPGKPSLVILSKPTIPTLGKKVCACLCMRCSSEFTPCSRKGMQHG